eukprot:1159731-Pelagomonas_calceolata.AAC.4
MKWKNPIVGEVGEEHIFSHFLERKSSATGAKGSAPCPAPPRAAALHSCFFFASSSSGLAPKQRAPCSKGKLAAMEAAAAVAAAAVAAEVKDRASSTREGSSREGSSDEE